MLLGIQTFPCPNCREIVNDSMNVCKYCSVPIDKGIAEMLVERQARVNRACSDASFLRSCAAGMYVLLFSSLIPLLGRLFWGFVVVGFVVLYLLIRWQVRSAGLVSDDPDYSRAGRNWVIALVLWIAAWPAAIVLLIFGAVIQTLISRALAGG